MRWQHWARAGIALAGLGCAAAVYLLFGVRRPPSPPPPPAVDPATSSQMGPGSFRRSKDGRDALLVEFAGRTTFSDGRVRLDQAHMQSFDERGLEIWADLYETRGKAVQADNPAVVDLSGHVRLVTKDGLEAHMERATYDDAAGTMATPGLLTFTRGRMSGGGEGATYDQKRDLLVLLDRAHITEAPDEQGTGALDATSRRITLDRPARSARFEGEARLVRAGDTLSGDTAFMRTSDDESRVTRIELRGHAHVMPGAATAATAPPDMRADDIDLDLHDDGQTVRQARLTGGTPPAMVDLTGEDGGHRKIVGSQIGLGLARDGRTLTAVDATAPVTLTLPKTAEAEARTIQADALHATGREGAGLADAAFDGRPQQPVRFAENVPGTGSGPGTTRIVRSLRLVLALGGQLDAIDRATFTGAVDLSDAHGIAHADIAEYDATDKTNRLMHLRPADATRPLPWAENADRHVEARAIDLFLDAASNDLDAAGSVATRVEPAPPAPGRPPSPLFSGASRIVGRAASLRYRGNQGAYTGAPGAPARVSQNASFVSGDTVVFDSGRNDLRADGHVESAWLADRKDGSASAQYRITNADALVYDDTARVARFTGTPATSTSADGTTTADWIQMTFESDSNAVRETIWRGHVRAELSGRRRGVGTELTYDARTDAYVLTGQAAQVLAPKADGSKCTLSEGDKLRFERTSGSAQGGMQTRDDIDCDVPLPYKGKEGMATLRTEGLTKAYGGRTVVRDVNLDVSSGEIVGLLGPNGAGKTTTFSMVVGLTGADAGQVLLDDQRVTSDPMYVRARKGIGYLPQEASIFRGLTVEQNVLAILETQPIGRAERKRRLAELLGELNLTPLARAKAHTLSGGERRRVEITRALVNRPKFMLLDEPFAGIDPIAVGDIQKIVFHLRDRGIGVLITDHNVRETLKITDRAYIVHGGAIFRSGTPTGLAADEEVKRIYLGADFRLD